MIMSIGKVNRACSGAVLGLILCALPGFAQRPANRNARLAQAPENPKAQRPKGRELHYAPNRYILFLGDEPLAAHFASRDQLQTAAAVSYRQQLESRQQSMIQNLTGRKIQVVGSVATVMNAIFVVATPDRVAELRGLPGVIGVMPERSVRPNLNKATALANAPAAWAQAAIGGQGNAGNGIKIAILDTGIDAGSVHTSPAFSDAGFTAPSGFPKCNAAVNGTPSDCGLYTNNKVIVARSYVSMIAAGNCDASGITGACTSAGTASANTSAPDDYSARDRDGHGSAVAAAAAAVQNSGGTVAFSGMAPKAYLGSYKVYGTNGVSAGAPESVIIKALDDAIADGMNVINYSSGVTPFAGAKDDVQCGNKAGVPCDPLANAFEVAAQNGTVIVTSAGNNSGPYGGQYYSAFNTIASPGTAPSVITVGATISSHIFGATVSVNGSGVAANLKNITANLSDAGFLPWVQSICTFYCAPPFYISGAISGVLVDVTTLGDNGQACSPLPAGSLTDAYALIQRSPASVVNCTFDLKAQNATAAGAIGIVFYMADSSALTTPDQICYDNTNGVCDLGGPAVMISLTDGQNLKAYIDAHPGTVVTIDTAGAEQALPNSSAVNALAIYSSEGPAIDGSIKPDMVATGGFDFNFGGPGLYTVGQSYDPERRALHFERLCSGQRHQFLGAPGRRGGGDGAAGASGMVGAEGEIGAGEFRGTDRDGRRQRRQCRCPGDRRRTAGCQCRSYRFCDRSDGGAVDFVVRLSGHRHHLAEDNSSHSEQRRDGFRYPDGGGHRGHTGYRRHRKGRPDQSDLGCWSENHSECFVVGHGTCWRRIQRSGHAHVIGSSSRLADALYVPGGRRLESPAQCLI